MRALSEQVHAAGVRGAGGGMLSRSGRRLRRVMLNSGAALVAKVASFLVTLSLFPLVMGYVGKSGFAVWLVAISLVQVLSWADLGLGNSALTRIARRPESLDGIRATISCAYACIAMIATIAGIALATLWHWGGLEFILQGPGKAMGEGARPLFAIALAAFGLWMPTALVTSIQTGLRMGGVANLCQAGSGILVGALTYFAVEAGSSLSALVAIACFTPIAVNAVNTAVFLFLRPDLRPQWSLVSWAECKELMRLGMVFLALQVGVMALTGADGIIVLRQAGPAEAVDYSAVAKLFGMVSALGATVFSPLWPEYGAAHARGEYGWLRRTYVRSLALGGLIGLAGGGLLAATSSTLFPLWLGPAVRPSTALVALAGTWLLVDLASQCTAMMLNGMAVVRPQIVTALLLAATCLPLKWLLAARYGASGIYVATLVCFLLAVALPYAVVIPRLLQERT